MFSRIDSEVFPQLYRRFRKPIFLYVSRRVRDAQIAEELTQDVFMKAYRARETYEPRFGLTTWLWTIAKNTVCDFHRRREPSAAIEVNGQSDVCAELVCPVPIAEVVLAAHGERSELLRRMSTLTDLQKKVLSLRVVQRLSYREIARKMGLSMSAAKCLFYRAKITLALPNFEFAGL